MKRSKSGAAYGFSLGKAPPVGNTQKIYHCHHSWDNYRFVFYRKFMAGELSHPA
jgi:hypothetical protein